MSKRIDESWVVFASIENAEHDRCVDLFYRPDGSFGFEEFRRDAEDAGGWTPVQFYSGASYGSVDDLHAAAARTIEWLANCLRSDPALKKRVTRSSNRDAAVAAHSPGGDG
jgi:hypothetical protein